MRVAFICKRRYMGHDVIDDRYARLYEIPWQLAARGHDVLGACLSYHGDAEGEWEHPVPGSGRLRWASRSLGRVVVPRLLGHPAWLLHHLREHGCDVVIAASDLPHVVVGAWAAERLGLPFVADLYDDFESFGLARIPGAVTAYRRAVSRADLVSCTSQALLEHVRDDYHARGHLLALPSTIDSTVFQRRDRQACRTALGLPAHARLVGTAGGLHADKGITTVYEAFERLASDMPDVHLVLAGQGEAQPPRGANVHHLGAIAHERVAQLFSALDVGIVYLRDTPFGRYCFPQKAYEMAACGTPIVAAAVGAMPALLAKTPQALYRPDDAAGLAAALRAQLTTPQPPPVVPEDWEALVGRLDHAIQSLTGRGDSTAPINQSP